MNAATAPTSGTATRSLLRCSDIHKSFGGVPVLRGVALELQPGTVTALAGENGAGKSTLMKIISGQYTADHGVVEVGETTLTPGNTKDAVRHGVAIVPQELASIEDMTVYENLFVGREIKVGPFLNRRAMIDEARDALGVFGIEINPSARMGSLPVGLRQIVEIVKAARTGARVVMLDEPTSAISEREVDGLYTVVRRLREHGVAMVYTTHKMAEIRAIADRVVVLRDGGLILDKGIDDVTDDEIVTAMIGRELDALFPERPTPGTEPALQVRDLHVQGATGPVSFTVNAGEIVGLAGLVGAGRTELLEAIFGARTSTAGTITVRGRTVKRNHPAAAISAGMAIVPEDRKLSGAVLSMSVLDNGTLPRLSSFSLAGWLRGKSRSKAVSDVMSSVRLRSRGLAQEVGTLSGGNQQKVVLARWLTGDVAVLLLDEPTRGVDVGARSEIYRIVTEFAAQGMAVLMASSDMPEVVGLSHRAFVMRGGTLVGELDRDALDHPEVQESVFRLATALDGGSEPMTQQEAP
ncbi:sugar ABC transporter ATP-binding protein [Mycobacterium sp. SMC-4]|uniref:sugar ABC transporter ATP-binding protein n=1 Tax=Mycobacterium sp. SMC-4 TaxID=2857059 RepID=UPI0021B3FFFA|nr:sugar ABC transporter ATP-binding protein [Mycobacterium sp. SMC-4]UXA15973.1 sugar ABC transporter ATP-binding protein [Mycobacterium sp. SMC-4]